MSSTHPPESTPRRLSLLYQLWLTNMAARTFMRAAMAGSGMTGEEYGLFSYLFANGARTLSHTARDLRMPVTTLATLLAPAVEAGDIERSPHPRDRRAKLLRLTDAGRARMDRAIPTFSAGYRLLLEQLAEDGVDTEDLYQALDQLRTGIEGAVDRFGSDDLAAGE
jgi:DNA-binding MarR family transcriptional regulator